MVKQLTLGFEGGLLSDLARYPCADVRDRFGNVRRPRIRYEDRTSEDPQIVDTEDIYYDLLRNQETKDLNVPKNWDLRKNDLTNFNRNTLEDIYYGIHNLWVPTEMLDLENPAEIIANYLAAGVLKRCNGHRINEQIPKGSFSELVQYMNRIAYSNPVFLKNFRSFKTRFSTNPRDQEKRLADLSGEVKRQFCASFYKPYRASRDEEPNNPNAFYDPKTQRGYADRIYQYFKGRFEREHKRQ